MAEPLVIPSDHRRVIAPSTRPCERWGHTAEELRDLSRTRYHGGDPIVSQESLMAALFPDSVRVKNAIRLRTRAPNGDLKQLIFDFNARTNDGGYMLMIAEGGDSAGTIQAARTSTGITATTLTDTGAAFPVSTTNQHGTGLVGHVVFTGSVYGRVLSNTATVLTVDQWYNVGSTVGAAAANPATGIYFVAPGQAPCNWIAISTDTTTEDIANTTLTGELLTGFTTVPRWFGVYSVITAPTGTGTVNSNAIVQLDGGVQIASATNTIAKLGLTQYQNGGFFSFTKKLTTSASVISGDTLDASWQITNS